MYADCVSFSLSPPLPVPRLREQAGGTIYAGDDEVVRLEVRVEGVGITGMEWRHKEMGTGPLYTVVSTTNRFTIAKFNSSRQLGRYEFVATNPAGQSILAIWELKQAGNKLMATRCFHT